MGDQSLKFGEVGQFGTEASQSRVSWVVKNASHRAAGSDPSLRKNRLLRTTID